ncbi:MAG: hypothetical protein ACJ77N_02905 [Chloroflexota bacterium]|jgi:hypothetical protein
MPHVEMPKEPSGGKVTKDDHTPGPAHAPSGELGGKPVNPGDTAPKDRMPDPPEGGNRQPRDPAAVDPEPGQDL